MVTVGYTTLRELTPGELQLLPDDEQSRTFGSDGRRQQFRAGRALVRLLLQETTGRPAAEHRITAEEGGKPICEDGPAISITHTGESVACSVADVGNVGIDLERIDEYREVSQIVQRFYSDEEKSWLEDVPGGFFMLWVLKEAFVKAHGQSIFGGLEKLRCTVEPPVVAAQASEGSFRDLGLYRHKNLFLGLATTEEDMSDVGFRSWSPGATSLEAGADFRLIATTNSEAQNNAAG